MFLSLRAVKLTIALIEILGVIGQFEYLQAQKPLFELFVPQGTQEEVIRLAVTRAGGKATVSEVATTRVGFNASVVVYHSQWDALLVTSARRELTQFAMLKPNSGREFSVHHRQQLPLSSGYTSLDRSGKFFLTVSYATGDLGVFAVDQDGVGAEPVCSVKVPNKEAHCILPSLDNRFIYIPPMIDSSNEPFCKCNRPYKRSIRLTY